MGVPQMKKLLARTILRWQLPRFSSDSHPFNLLLGNAIELQRGSLTDDAFRVCLEEFYRKIDLDSIKRDIEFPKKVARLDRPGGYKTDVAALDTGGVAPTPPGRFDLWGRRFSLLRRIGIRSDVLILRRGETVPPHGHHRVVSGFYVLEGRIAIRHYDRIRSSEENVHVRKVLDTELGPGGFTTNSEAFHNIHWLQGLAEKSFLFRVTVTDTPTKVVGDLNRTDSRLYIDPTAEPDPTGMIIAPFISEAEAKRLLISK